MYESHPSRAIEIETAAALRRHIERNESMRDVVVQGVDLSDGSPETALMSVSAEDAIFLGCELSDAAKRHIRETGGTIFPTFVDVPFNPYRASLYTPEELMQGYELGVPDTRTETLDARIYDYFSERQLDGRDAPVTDALAFRIHDHAVDDALRDFLHPENGPDRRVVGVMGGHRLGRGHRVFRQVAGIARRLAQEGFLVATGGGPGAMEAANLGAALAEHPRSALQAAIETLAGAPDYEDDEYLERAMAVRNRYTDRAESLAVPTWFYGHEPSNLFATHIAKYFANSIREDGLLAIARYGVLFAPGSAGTIQEVFMDAAQNHYETFGPPSPMVFVGREYWTEEKPVYPLLKTLAAGNAYADQLSITDEVDDAVSAVTERVSGRSE